MSVQAQVQVLTLDRALGVGWSVVWALGSIAAPELPGQGGQEENLILLTYT